MASKWAKDDVRVRLWRVAGWTALIWVVVFWRLGYLGLLDPDEAHYAQITKEMLLTRQWLVPLIGGHPFIDKPVLFHWLQGLAFAALGVSEFAARLPSAIAALGLTWTTYWAGRELFDRSTGAFAAAMLLTMPATFALASIGLFDMLFTALLFGAVACLVVAVVKGRGRVQWVGYLLLSLAILTKGPVAVLLLGVAFAGAMMFMPAARDDLRRLRWFAGPLAAVALVAPWFVWMGWRFGAEFVQRYIIQGNVWYVTHPFEYRQSNNFFYVRTFFGAFAPWSFVAVGRALSLIRLRTTGADRGELLLYAWAVAVLGVFTIARFKLDHYIYPVAPVVCLSSARAWAALRDARTSAPFQRIGLIAMPVVLVAGAYVLAWAMFDIDLRISPAAILLPVGVAAGGVAFILQVRACGWRPPATPALLIATLVVVYASVVVFGLPVLERVRPTPSIGRWISRHQPPSAKVGLFELGEWEASLRFYSDRDVEPLNDAAELQRFLARPGRGSVVMLRHRYDALRKMGVPLRRVYGRDAVIGRTGVGLRHQLWGRVVVAIGPAEPWPVFNPATDLTTVD